ncbi:hypothetical protein KIL84_006375 [Mauremys mutica]|uniref:Uncharacterized protein n=1 Tax=Mauremys mutica TaxID=74926 RepID=A0A9D4APG0_9SAUR|nr:hypothetical protein KIL84_006375 [Mauremys mutica]
MAGSVLNTTGNSAEPQGEGSALNIAGNFAEPDDEGRVLFIAIGIGTGIGIVVLGVVPAIIASAILKKNRIKVDVANGLQIKT